MKDLKYEVMSVIKHNKDGSFATRAKRKEVLSRACGLLWTKFPGLKLTNLQRKHCDYLVDLWRLHKSAKTEISHLRWLLEKTGKAYLLPSSNAELNIPRRIIVSNENKSWIGKADVEDVLQKIADDNVIVEMALRLCILFGLRMKESVLFYPHEHIKDDYIEVYKGTKGGRYRVVPIFSNDQREFLEKVKKEIAPGKGLIPTCFNFKKFKNQFYYRVRKFGIKRSNGLTTHGLRHTYAATRYEELSGIKPPVLQDDQSDIYKHVIGKQKDNEVREKIANELGHGRTSVTAAYIGGKGNPLSE